MIHSRTKSVLEQEESDTMNPSHAIAPSETTEMLTIRAVRHFPGFTLNIDFTVPPGLTVLFGPSGSGKSLTLQALAGLCQLDSAHIALGHRLWHDSEKRFFLPPQQRRVGYVPQSYALFPHLTVAQNIAFGLKLRGQQARQRVAELINLVHLDGLEHLRPAQLSGGQQQRVALARALATEPHLLLLDEPLSALDAAVRETLREELRAFYERVRVPMVLVTHDAQEAHMLADTVVVLQHGRVLQTGSTEQVFRSPATEQVADLVGMHTRWHSTIESIEQVGTHREITLNIEGLRLKAWQTADIASMVGQSVTVGIRTDELQIDLGKSAEQQQGIFSARIGTIRERGTFSLVTVYLSPTMQVDIPVMRWQQRSLALSEGTEVMLHIPREAVHLFADAHNSLK
jgi:molybdate transport system ATP-binding protein